MIVNILLAILLISVLIIVHEFGHFLAAKANGVAVLEFAIGFGPHIFRKRFGDTDFSINCIPFGGYCMILGADDEDEDEEIEGQGENGKDAGSGATAEENASEREEQEQGDAQEDLSYQDIHARDLLKKYGNSARLSEKSVGVRMAIAFAGPLFNFLLAFVLAILVIGNVGVDLASVSEVQDGSPAQEAGLQPGDLIRSVNGHSVTFTRDYDFYVSYHGTGTQTIQYLRDGQEYTAVVTPVRQESETYQIGILLNADGSVNSVSEDSPAKRAGLQAGDILKKVGDMTVTSGTQAVDAIRSAGGTSIPIVIERDGQTATVSVTPQLVSNVSYITGLGVSGARVKTTPFDTIAYAVKDVAYWSRIVVQSLGMMFTGQLTVNDLSGPVGIAQAVGQVVSTSRPDGLFYVIMNLLLFMEAISANLGVMNLLPLPGLDGGQILLLIIEAIRRKPMKKEYQGRIQLVGMVLLFALSLYVMFHDITRLF